MNFWLAFALYVTLLGSYWFFVWSIVWHVREYTLPDDRSRAYINIFFVVIGILSALSLLLFFSLPLTF